MRLVVVKRGFTCLSKMNQNYLLNTLKWNCKLKVRRLAKTRHFSKQTQARYSREVLAVTNIQVSVLWTFLQFPGCLSIVNNHMWIDFPDNEHDSNWNDILGALWAGVEVEWDLHVLVPKCHPAYGQRNYPTFPHGFLQH